jgi:ribonuclease P protein component
VPRAASGSPPELPALSAARVAYPPARRLRTPAQFAATAGREGDPVEAIRWRSGRRFVAAQARIAPMTSPAVDVPAPLRSAAVTAHLRDAAPRSRFGITVGKRNARLAVDRALIKRVLREAARHAAPALDAAAGDHQVDIVLRLKTPCPNKTAMPRPQLKKLLRQEADDLLAQLAVALRRHAAGAPTVGAAP